MTKRIISWLLAVTLIFSLGISTYAAVQVVSVTPKLTFNGTTANCSVGITGSGYIDATLELTCGGSSVCSWNATGYGYVSFGGPATVVSGNTYTLTVSGTAGGAPFSSPPVTKTCP